MSGHAEAVAGALAVPLSDGPAYAQAIELIARAGLPGEVAWLGRGCGVVVLRMEGRHPLDDLLAWAGEMAGEPHWWTVRHYEHLEHDRDRIDLWASGLVQGLAVTVSAPAPRGLSPCPSTGEVIERATGAALAEVHNTRPAAGEGGPR